MRNPTIELKGKKVYADGKSIGELKPDDLAKNIVFFFNESDKHPLMPHGWFFLNLVDTPEHAQEVAKGGEGKSPIIFFPGGLSRAPNFPTVWKKKFYHPGIIAAVQGQFRGGTKLHIEYMNVRPGYRRNKIMDILITYLEEHFEPKAKEFHELTKDGKAFVKGTKRNPYPDDNTLPDDFKPNFKKWLDWNSDEPFCLNVKAKFEDHPDVTETICVTDGRMSFIYPFTHCGPRGCPDADHDWIHLSVEKNVLNHANDEKKVIKDPYGGGELVIINWRSIMRELIEKGMKQEGYKAKKNPIKPTARQVKWAHGEAEGIAFYDIDPLEFLRLTAESPEHFHSLLKHSKPMEFYNSPEVQKELIVHPAIWIDDKGKIDAHEGRHRAAATYNAGEKTYRIAIIAEERGWPVKDHGWRWKRRLKVPPQFVAQYPGMDRYTHEVDATKLEEIPTYYEVDKEDDVRTTRKKKNPFTLQGRKNRRLDSIKKLIEDRKIELRKTTNKLRKEELKEEIEELEDRLSGRRQLKSNPLPKLEFEDSE